MTRFRRRGMSIAELRAECPSWTWRGQRYGFGWHYEGTRGDERVLVYSVATLCGPAEDDYATEWRVHRDDPSGWDQHYSSWWLEHAQ